MGERKSIQFIVNPVSGYKNNEDMLTLIRNHLDHKKFDFSYVETQARGHGKELSQQAVASGVDIIVACGGDGTVNEVAGPVTHSNSTLAILPNGSGNGFAMHVGMGRNSVKAIHKINNGETLTIDTCTVNGEFFLNLAGIGFDALIAYKADKDTKRGLRMYASIVSKELMAFQAERYRVKMDDEEITGEYTVVAIANAAMYGYNFHIAPLAKLTDGLLDVVFIKKASLLRTLGASWRMLNKSLDNSALVEIKKAQSVTVSMEQPYYYHVDGESKTFDEPLHFNIIPQSLKILLPSDSIGRV